MYVSLTEKKNKKNKYRKKKTETTTINERILKKKIIKLINIIILTTYIHTYFKYFIFIKQKQRIFGAQNKRKKNK